ncbi:universal stress protein [Streptomyces sp. NPDC051000]|uniref:universal stress protein n=1 Tax=Streptomyces sp. NPDC051000 TaxID=3155520 RepID=UPI0033DCCAEC
MKGSTRHLPDLGPVVVGVDGSSTALTAAFWAAAEASRRNSTLHIFYAADTADRNFYLSAHIIERVHAEGRDLLEVTAAAVSERFPTLHVSTEYSLRDPVSGPHRVGAKYGITVVGHRGLGGFESLMPGSVGLRIAAAATTPVIVVRGGEDLAESGVVPAAVRRSRGATRHDGHRARAGHRGGDRSHRKVAPAPRLGCGRGTPPQGPAAARPGRALAARLRAQGR